VRPVLRGHRAQLARQVPQGRRARPARPAGPASGAQGPAGPAGPAGPEGEPWAAGGTLPSGATETGVWGAKGSGGPEILSIGFTLPLTQEPEAIFVNPGEASKPGCPGRGGGTPEDGYVPTTPEAEPGKLCVYAMQLEGAVLATPAEGIKHWQAEEFAGELEYAQVPGAGTAGAILRINCTASCTLGGTWAVTAP